MEQLEYSSVNEDREQDILARLRAAPGNISILLELQAYYKEQARYEEEVAILRQLLEKDLSPDERAEALHDLGYALYRQGNLEEAIPRAEDLLDTYPGYRYLGSVYRLLGVMYAERSAWQGDSETEIQDLKTAARHLRYALGLVEDGQERAAVLVDLGAVLSNSGELEEAKHIFEEALRIGIEEPNTLVLCYRRLGRTLHTLGQVDQAISYYEKSASLHSEQPDNSWAMTCIDLAGLYREKGDIERAEQYCRRAMQWLDQSDAKWASYVLGRIYEELGDILVQKGAYQEAVDNYYTALQQIQRPDEQADLYRKLGVTLDRVEQYHQAFEAFRQALVSQTPSAPVEKQEDVGDLLFRMGQCAYKLGDFRQAIVLLEKAVERLKPPLLAEAYLWLGHSYFSTKRGDRAAGAYKKVIMQTRFLSPTWRQAMRYFVWASMAR